MSRWTTPAVGMLERRTELGADFGELAVAELSGGGELAQVRPLDQLADQVGAPVVAAELVEGDDPGVVEAGRRVRLAHHPLGVLTLDRLDGDPAAEALVPGAMDGAVAAAADPLADREPAQYALAFDHGDVSPRHGPLLPRAPRRAGPQRAPGRLTRGAGVILLW